MNELTDFIKAFAPYIGTLFVLIVVGLFLAFRSDAVKAGEPFPTRLAVQQTLSTIRNGRLAIRGGEKPAHRPRTSDELKGTVSGASEIRAEDIAALIAKQRKQRKPPFPPTTGEGPE